MNTQQIIDEQSIEQLISSHVTENPETVRAILKKALLLKGLSTEEVAALLSIQSPTLLDQLFQTAKQIKEMIYGNRIVMFAPLYISNLCGNDCAYCAFRATNQAIKRRALTQAEIAQEVRQLIDQGHKRLLLVAGEAYPNAGFQYILDAIATVYNTKTDRGTIRRLNVNIAPLSTEDFQRLKQTNIGTYQLFQETYHRPTYDKVHLSGKKKEYDWRLEAIDRAIQAGIDDVGIGVLFGLADWRFEILALLQHTEHLNGQYGVGPHTISVPRLEPAVGSEIAACPPHPVSDVDFAKIIAILRLAVPYTGIILSTRESPETRRAALALGISQISAGSRTNPGGYSEEEDLAGQFSLGDHRSLDEVIYDIASMGYLPSFCTACYRLGRTGHDFMNLAKPGEIKHFCSPNALATFAEYLIDFAAPKTRAVGEQLIQQELEKMGTKAHTLTAGLLEQVKAGKRDVFV
ncbi:MAG: [FeFe] hydrogenase H-cluster radical SAM maturase HydG [Gammaproteobacteria bacterium GWE2_42_36]|nr:MAG: [FeFe] hydrogenase H-cluster radical SAM maturase HydG [Gammaproteobacteria bacterium GWE2_42_36]HCU05955.1 [FeFe] hydrogenase H-cluster radical SAM maturase HydG [Coxiellaceae bacterium]